MNFIFDFDGTLLNTKVIMKEALIETLNFFHVPLPEDISRYVEEPVRLFEIDILFKFTDKELSDFLEMYRSSYLRKRVNKARLFKNVIEVLEVFKSNDIKMFLISNSTLEISKKMLELLHIDNFFTEVIGSDSLKVYKPHPQAIEYIIDKYKLDKSNTYVIGDSPNDIRMAVSAEVKSCAMLTGVSSKEILELENPTYIFNKIEDLLLLI